MNVLKNNIVKCFLTLGQSSLIPELRHLYFPPSLCCHGSFDPSFKSSVYLLLVLQDNSPCKVRDCCFLILFWFWLLYVRVKNGTHPQFKVTKIQKRNLKNLPQMSLIRSRLSWYWVIFSLNICYCVLADIKIEKI